MSADARDTRPESMLAIRQWRVRVRYRAGIGDDARYRAEVARADEALRAGAGHGEDLYRQLAASTIESWDLHDEDGRPVAVTAAALQSLPIGALRRIVREATQPAPRTDRT